MEYPLAIAAMAKLPKDARVADLGGASSLLGLYLPFLFSGAVLVEVVFAWPGMGRTIFDAITQRDYPTVMATTFVFAVMVVIANLIADILYAAVDPRIRYEGGRRE